MRNTADFHDARALRRQLYIVAVVCFGPLALILLLGLFVVPIWVGMIAMHVAQPEQFSNGASGTIWSGVWPIVLVVSGIVGVVGLFRVLALLSHSVSTASKRLTLVMVSVGLTALLVFDLMIFVPIFFSTDAEQLPVVGLLIYVVLPFVGATWILSEVRALLFTDSR